LNLQDDNSDTTYRCGTSAILGVVLFLFYFQPFLPYSQRPELSSIWWLFPIIVFLGGFTLSLGVARDRFLVPTCLLLALFLANIVLIAADTITDTYDRHNLAPIEFIFITLLTVPAYVGAFLAAAVDRFRDRRVKA
jgi:hypothetical protein